MERESIRVTRSVALPAREIELRFSRSSGPGGQHAQKTRDARRGDLRRRGVVGADRGAEAARCSRRPGRSLRAVAQDERSQLRGTASSRSSGSSRRCARRSEWRAAACRRSRAAAARERRLEEKRRRGETKRLRRAAATSDPLRATRYQRP